VKKRVPGRAAAPGKTSGRARGAGRPFSAGARVPENTTCRLFSGAEKRLREPGGPARSEVPGGRERDQANRVRFGRVRRGSELRILYGAWYHRRPGGDQPGTRSNAPTALGGAIFFEGWGTAFLDFRGVGIGGGGRCKRRRGKTPVRRSRAGAGFRFSGRVGEQGRPIWLWPAGGANPKQGFRGGLKGGGLSQRRDTAGPGFAGLGFFPRPAGASSLGPGFWRVRVGTAGFRRFSAKTTVGASGPSSSAVQPLLVRPSTLIFVGRPVRAACCTGLEARRRRRFRAGPVALGRPRRPVARRCSEGSQIRLRACAGFWGEVRRDVAVLNVIAIFRSSQWSCR